MKSSEAKRFNELDDRHVKLLNLKGKSQKTIEAYARLFRLIPNHHDC